MSPRCSSLSIVTHSPFIDAVAPNRQLRTAILWHENRRRVDKLTRKSSQQVLPDFGAFNPWTVTEGDIINFLDEDFGGEGLGLQSAALPRFDTNLPFLNGVIDPLLKAFSQIVHGYWMQLARTVNESALCRVYPSGACEGTFIPLNHSFVVSGRHFQEQCEWGFSSGRVGSGLSAFLGRSLGQPLDCSRIVDVGTL